MQKVNNEKSTGKVKKFKHQKWTAAEDAQLYKLLIGQYSVNLDNVAKLMYNRNARQCKDRWNYYLCPTVNNGDWSHEEDELLNQKVKELGTKWKEISTFFIGRTNTNCKNRWLAMQREKMKSINSAENANVAPPAGQIDPNSNQNTPGIGNMQLQNTPYDFDDAFTDHDLELFEL